LLGKIGEATTILTPGACKAQPADHRLSPLFLGLAVELYLGVEAVNGYAQALGKIDSRFSSIGTYLTDKLLNSLG
jgi:hypothetical protein